MADPHAASEAFEAVASYLGAAGWHQDGDDPGVWRLDVHESDEFAGVGVSIGDALAIQFDQDGFAPWIYRVL